MKINAMALKWREKQFLIPISFVMHFVIQSSTFTYTLQTDTHDTLLTHAHHYVIPVYIVIFIS